MDERAQWILLICFALLAQLVSLKEMNVLEAHFTRKLQSMCVCSRNRFVCTDAHVRVGPRTIRPKTICVFLLWIIRGTAQKQHEQLEMQNV